MEHSLKYLHGFAIELEAPDIACWENGNTGIPFFWTFRASQPGPHVLLLALTHGDEICGAIALNTLLGNGLRPRRGTLSLGFANTAGYGRWDPARPNAGFFVDEDLNRVWHKLDTSGDSVELLRAREMRPLVDTVDYLLDIHSTQYECPPLFVSGWTDKSRQLAKDLGFPGIIIADSGHKAGTRLRDYAFFADERDPRAALVVECGQHWRKGTETVALHAALGFLAHFGMVDAAALAPYDMPAKAKRAQVIEVTETITVTSDDFAFNRIYTDLEVIAAKGSVLGTQGGKPIVTPHDDAVLIMPIRRKIMGVTAVRFGRYLE